MKYFYEPIKITQTKDHKVHWWSDTHWGHDRGFIWESRGDSDIVDHDNNKRDAWNSKIRKEDTVFFLGDIIFGKDAENRLIDFLYDLNFSKLYIMPGNHSSGYRHLFNKTNPEKEIVLTKSPYKKVVSFVPNYLEAVVNDQKIIMSHYPILVWNVMHHESWHVFGHCHDTLKKVDWVKNNYLTGKCLDVGVDSCPSPVSFDELKKYMNKQIRISPDGHTK